MACKILISGLGIISSLGQNVTENLSSLKSLKSGIKPISFLNTLHCKEFQAGEVDLTNEELASKLDLTLDNNYPRTALLAIHAAKEAYNNSKLHEVDGNKIGLISGTTVGGMDKTEKYYLNPENNPDFILSHSCGYINELVARHIDANGYLATINTACSSSANAILTGARLIKHGILDIVIAGGFDSLTKFTLNGFKTLLILSPEKCTPFDENRNGLNLGEGAGFVVLESEESVIKRGASSICELSGYANSNDAYHQTASSPDGEGAFLSMQNALKKADLTPGDIDYINVHGTGTENNDLTEGIAIKRIFKDEIPPFSSTKSYTGHTLGAAGGIEAVFSSLSIKEKIIFPNLNFKTPISELEITPNTKFLKNTEVNHVMSNSFGFGGNDSTLIFSKI